MKGQVASGVLGLSLLAFTAWRVTEGPPDPPPAPDRVVLHARDDGRDVRLHRGQWLAVQLPAHSASGYRCWLQDSAAGVLELEQEPTRLRAIDPWLFRTARSGHSTLRFECRQEMPEGPVRQFVFRVRTD